MGGKSKSSSSQTTQQTDRRIGATDSAVVATEGASITSTTTVESVDPEIAQTALEEAFGFGRAAIDASTEAVAGAQKGFERGLAEQSALIENVATQGSEKLQGLKSLLTTTAIVAVGAFVAMRR